MAAIDVRRAGEAFGRLARRPRLRDPLQVAEASGRLVRRALAASGVVLPDLLAVELLLVATAFLFRDAILDGRLFHEADTSTMFYPVFAALGSALGRGELLLWSPELFSGFPLLAEGQTGVLYPLNWLAATLLPTQEGFIWVRIVHFGLACLFAYLFGRSLRLSPGPAAILALSFSFGSFMVGQMQHQSVVASATWMPLVLALTEIGFRSRGLVRLRYLVLAGLALGMSALGVHTQTVAMAGACFVGWVLFRLVFPPRRLVPDRRARRAAVSREQARRWRDRRAAARAAGRLRGIGRAWWPPTWFDWLSSYRALVGGAGRLARGAGGRLGLSAGALVLVPLLAMAIAAAQLLPLYELSQESGRAFSWSYRDATDYSLPIPNLITLVFPFFFRDGQGGGWSLWQPWEVTYYAGVVPLALAALGVFYSRRREALYFVVLGAVATLFALGDYSPLNVYAYVWNLPGLNLQRAPARYSYLGVFAIAALAGLGSQALWENLRSWPSGARRTMRLLVFWLAGLVVVLATLAWHLVAWRGWLQAEPLAALAFLERHYLSQRHDPGVVDSAQKAYSGLWRSLDLTNPHTALPLLLLALLLLLVVCWNELRRLRAVWQSLLVLLVALDVLTFAHEYHPLVSIDEIADVGESGRFLARQSGLFRVYTHPDVAEPKANELLPWEVAEARAYDPLELSRDRVLVGSITYVDNWLLDLMGVRYRLLPADQPGLPSYRQTGFNPQHPLLSGGGANPSGREVWSVPGDTGDELRVISVLENAFGVDDGEQVGEWILTDTSGRQRTFPMLAGRDTADWTYDDPIYSARPAHSRARVAFTFDLPAPLASGARQVNLYYTSFPLPDRPSITRVEFRQTSQVGRMQVFGFGFFDQARGLVAQFYDREKYQTVFRDASVVIQENRAVFPRAFAVPDAVVVESANDALELLSHGPIQPRRQAVFEADDAPPEAVPPAPPAEPAADRLGQPYGNVDVLEYAHESVSVRATTDGGYLVLADAYYPGWKAYVDGEETRLFRADYLFRAVALPPGTHLVQFRYQPDSFETGATIARVALALAALALLASFTPSVWRRIR